MTQAPIRAAVKAAAARVPAVPYLRTDCDRCNGHMYISVPVSNPYYAAKGATETQPCPVCNAAELPKCPICDDRGMIRLDVPVSHPQFGKPVACPAQCAAVQQQRADRADRMAKYARLPQDYQACSFALFDTLPEEFKQGKLNARRAAELFVDAAARQHYISAGFLHGHLKSVVDEERNWLIFEGPHGRGKTGLAASIVNAMTAAGLPVMYIRLQDAFTAIQKRYREDWSNNGDRDDFERLSWSAVLDEIRTAPVLIIDEWFVSDRAETQDKRDKLENIMRYRSAERLPTVITTNHSLDALESAWGTTTLSVVRARSFVVPVTGLPLRPDAIDVPA